MVVLVDVDHAFFHCAKAYMRSGIWKPDTWRSSLQFEKQQPYRVEFGRYFAQNDPVLADRIDQSIADHYETVQKAIDGVGEEQEI